MAKTQLPVPADLRNYYLPIGGLGFLNQLLHVYVLLMIICGQRPLSPWRPIQHPKYTSWLCSVLLICIVGFHCDSLSHLHNWQHITSMVGNMILFISFVAVAIAACNQSKSPAAVGPQADAVMPTKPATVNEHEEPERSIDLEKCELVNERPKSSLDPYKSWPLDADVIGVAENPANRIPYKDTPATETASVSTTVHKDDPTPPAPRLTRDIEDDPTEGAFIFLLACNMPPTVVVFAGIVGNLAQNLPSDWLHISQFRAIIITFSIFLVATVLITAASALRLRHPREKGSELPSPKPKTWKDAIMMGSMALNFFVVAFDKWLLAALAGDTGGAKHIVGHHGVPLAYMIVTNLLPAFAL